MPKIPNIPRFRGDNETSFDQWCLYFESQLKALGVTDEKRRDILVCCTEGGAFTFVSKTILENSNISYENLKKAIREEFCGEEYKRTLEAKLRNLKFKKGVKITSFSHELRMTVSELYALRDKAAIEAIATSHVMSSLDDRLRKEVQILQLAGNAKLENLLELIETKLEGNPMAFNMMEGGGVEKQGATAATSSVMSQDSVRITKLENMMERLLTKMDAQDRYKLRDPHFNCDHCGKAGHTRERCFQLKRCFKCDEVGHISKFCKKGNAVHRENRPNTTAIVGENLDCVKPGKRLIIKVKIVSQIVNFLYDPGSQFTIISRDVYDSLAVKPPLQPVQQAGVGITGTTFNFDGLVYINLGLEKSDGNTYTLEYEPVLVSSKINTSIFGINTEQRFEEIRRKNTEGSLTFVTKEHEEIIIRAYREQPTSTSAYVQVSKVTLVDDGLTALVQGKLKGGKSLSPPVFV